MVHEYKNNNPIYELRSKILAYERCFAFVNTAVWECSEVVILLSAIPHNMYYGNWWGGEVNLSGGEMFRLICPGHL